MLEKVSTILKMADESNTAVISFICTDYNMVYSVVTTAEKTNLPPALVMLLPEHYEKNNTMNVHGCGNGQRTGRVCEGTYWSSSGPQL